MRKRENKREEETNCYRNITSYCALSMDLLFSESELQGDRLLLALDGQTPLPGTTPEFT